LTESRLYEALGRELAARAELLGEYRSLLSLVARLKSGEVTPDRVVILPGDSWRLLPPEESTEPK
jgi:hypothetical protein